MADSFRFDIIQKKYKTASLNMMREIAMANKNYFLDNFKTRQGWGTEKWQEVKRRIPGTKQYEYPKNKDLQRRTRPILVGKGSLRRAVNSSIKLVTTNRAYFRVELPYAAIHNEGGTIQTSGTRVIHRSGSGRIVKSTSRRAKTAEKRVVASHTIQMPKRQYMGMNKETNVLTKSIITKYANKAFQG